LEHAPAPFENLKRGHYRVILIDPCYKYKMRSAKGYAKSPESHYPTMSEEELMALPVGELAGRRCLLVQWSTWPHLPQALRLQKHWGFDYVTGGSWTKRTVNGKAGFGTGFVLRSATEPFIIGSRRGMSGSKSLRNLIEAEEVIEGGWSVDALKREHSRKPDEMRALCDELSAGGPACELFAREAWAGRDVWGNEVNKFSPVAAEGFSG
jgi:N6-adenosine-specific RNA methylase IME4